jgi:hypothetical protein
LLVYNLNCFDSRLKAKLLLSSTSGVLTSHLALPFNIKSYCSFLFIEVCTWWLSSTLQNNNTRSNTVIAIEQFATNQRRIPSHYYRNGYVFNFMLLSIFLIKSLLSHIVHLKIRIVNIMEVPHFTDQQRLLEYLRRFRC